MIKSDVANFSPVFSDNGIFHTESLCCLCGKKIKYTSNKISTTPPSMLPLYLNVPNCKMHQLLRQNSSVHSSAPHSTPHVKTFSGTHPLPPVASPTPHLTTPPPSPPPHSPTTHLKHLATEPVTIIKWDWQSERRCHFTFKKWHAAWCSPQSRVKT